MAGATLPSSGMIKLSEIANAVGQGLTNQSLGTASDTAGFSEPDKMSDFYGYSAATYTAFSSSTAQSNSSNACFSTRNQTYYHNGSNSYPALNDYVYTDSAGTTTVGGGYYNVDFPGGDWVRINGFGRIYQTGICQL